MPYMSCRLRTVTWNNGVHNTVLNAKDDITWYKGNHKITAGISFEYQMADNSYMRNGTGYYRYHSLDDFLTGAAPETVALTYVMMANKTRRPACVLSVWVVLARRVEHRS